MLAKNKGQKLPQNVPEPTVSADTSVRAPPSTPSVQTADAPAPAVATEAKALEAPAEPEVFEPLLVKVEKGTVHIVGKLGKTLLYIEGEAFGFLTQAKVFVLGVMVGTKEKLLDFLEPAILKLQVALSPAIDKAQDSFLMVKSKILTVAAPFQARIESGVCHIRVVVNNTYVSLSAKARTTWTAVSLRVQPLVDWTVGKAEPLLTQTRDGCFYMQTAIGNTVVRIKVGSSEACGRVYACVSNYAAPLIEQVVAMYQKISTRVMTLLSQCSGKLKGLATSFSLKLQNVTVAIKVRGAKAVELARTHASTCYVKVNHGFLYVYGLVGENVVYIKVSVNDLLAKLSEKTARLGAASRGQLLALKDAIQAKVIDTSDAVISKTKRLGTTVRVTVNDRSVQMTAAGALSGAAAMGTTGGASGLVVGAACGLPAAFFTFGLSIPVGALLGGTTGLVAGGTAGLIGGGAAGHSAHKHKDEIRNGMSKVSDRASTCKVTIKERARGYKDYMAQKTDDMRARLVSGTGGTA